MSEHMTREQRLLLVLLRRALMPSGQPVHPVSTEPEQNALSGLSPQAWHDLLTLGERHAVLPLLYDTLEPYFPKMSGADAQWVSERTRTCVRQYYFLNYLTANVARALNEAGIPVAVFKGVSAAACYPKPACRKSGDIDLFLLSQNEGEGNTADSDKQIRLAERVLLKYGFQRQAQQTTTYHVVFGQLRGPKLELHTFLTEPFESEQTNRAIWRIIRSGALSQKRIVSEGDTFPVFGDAGIAFSLLVHMLHHYMRSGFGLKYLADWVVFWNLHRDETDPAKAQYRNMVKACGVSGFSDAITGICEQYLGLCASGGLYVEKPDAAVCEALLADILGNSEFGGVDAASMVALKDGSAQGYLREFHHRMKLNYPKASGHYLLYPALWIATLLQFLKNNRRVRHTSVRAVMRRAGERGELSRRMHLFREE